MVRIVSSNLQMEKLRLRNTEGPAGRHTNVAVNPTEEGQVVRDLELT